MGLELKHIELKDANDFISRNHRHHKPVVGHRFSLGAFLGDKSCVGVVVVGRPVARRTDHRSVAEVTRLCTDGTKNACSFLYSAAARAAKALGFAVIQTFILDTEPGTSLLATGWEEGHMTKAEKWNRPSRGGRREDQPNCRKVKWFKYLTVEEHVQLIQEMHEAATQASEGGKDEK